MSLIDEMLLFLGKPIPIRDICYVYPLKINEIYNESLGRNKYNLYVNLLTLDEDDIISAQQKKGKILQESDIQLFKYFLDCAQYDNQFFLDLSDALSTFIKEKVTLIPKLYTIIIGNPMEKRFLTEPDFLYLQNIIRAQNNLYIKEEAPPDEDAMHRKFRIKRNLREKVKQKQATKEEDGISFLDQISSLIVANIGINYDNIGECTLYPIKVLIDRMQAKENYENNLQFLCAGADSKKIKTKYWIRNLKEK